MARAQLALPLRAGPHLESARRQKPMPLGQVAGCQPMPVIRPVAQIEWHDRAVQHRHDPAQRPHPGEQTGATPAHRFRPRKPPQQAGHHAGNQAGGIDPGRQLIQHPELTLLAQRLRRRRVLAQKPRQRLLRRAHPRPALAAPALRDTGLHRQCQRDATRAIERSSFHRPQRRQRLHHQPGEISRPPLLHARRDFLAEQFQKELRHRGAHPPARPRSSLSRGCARGR